MPKYRLNKNIASNNKSSSIFEEVSTPISEDGGDLFPKKQASFPVSKSDANHLLGFFQEEKHDNRPKINLPRRNQKRDGYSKLATKNLGNIQFEPGMKFVLKSAHD